MEVKIFDTAELTVAKMALKFSELVHKSVKGRIHVALSGGATPNQLFSLLRDEYQHSIPWEIIHFYWVDERFVPPANPESNYHWADYYLLMHVDIPVGNIHRIKGEANPSEELIRYSKEIAALVPQQDGYPRFDIIFLGMGTDGHTGSIFADQMELLTTNRFCSIGVHPQTRQRRLTFTGKLINNAEYVAFLVTGADKALAVEKVIKEKDITLPATHIQPTSGVLEWYLDRAASSKLK